MVFKREQLPQGGVEKYHELGQKRRSARLRRRGCYKCAPPPGSAASTECCLLCERLKRILVKHLKAESSNEQVIRATPGPVYQMGCIGLSSIKKQ